jgi:amino-acid N-acetyltransferase
MRITPVSQNNLPAAIALLRQHLLPTDDITETTKFFVFEEDNEVLGTVALEFEGAHGLLRSLSVTDAKRNNGRGGKLVAFIEAYAKKKGVRQLFLLTTTAENFFLKNDYVKIDRVFVPDFIRHSAEFSSVCPASAVVMKKNLA